MRLIFCLIFIVAFSFINDQNEIICKMNLKKTFQEKQMKLFTKVLIITGIPWLLFLTLTSHYANLSNIVYFALACFFFILTVLLLHFFIIKRLNNLQYLVKPINDDTSPPLEKNYLIEVDRFDTLTSLPNRIVFNEILNKSINHSKRRKQILAILLINIDSFKVFRETLGPEKGDFILQEMANRFSHVLRSEDVLAKLEGDEYIVLLNDIAKTKFASTVAQKLLQACSQPLLIGTRDYFLTASIGIVVYPHDSVALEELLTNVNLALYNAKRGGKNNYQFYTQEFDKEARKYIQLENALRNAIRSDQLSLHYQPKVHIKSGNIAGIEALIRWEHPDLGVINPSVLIPLAEETGMIMQIGEWALREACKINKYWQDEGYEHLTVSLNLSPKQFHHPEIVDVISSILKETKLNPIYLELEIDEKTVMDDIATSITILKNIKNLGVQISLDHFGTGYTSISHLKQFPISVLKIDQSFIKGIPTIPDDLAITSALISLAHHLGLTVVAQGVETAEQVQYLSTQECDMIQGYFLSHPLPAQTIILQFKKLGDKVLL